MFEFLRNNWILNDYGGFPTDNKQLTTNHEVTAAMEYMEISIRDAK